MKRKSYAPGEARTHGLQIMRLTRCLLRYRGWVTEQSSMEILTRLRENNACLDGDSLICACNCAWHPSPYSVVHKQQLQGDCNTWTWTRPAPFELTALSQMITLTTWVENKVAQRILKGRNDKRCLILWLQHSWPLQLSNSRVKRDIIELSRVETMLTVVTWAGNRIARMILAFTTLSKLKKGLLMAISELRNWTRGLSSFFLQAWKANRINWRGGKSYRTGFV